MRGRKGKRWIAILICILAALSGIGFLYCRRAAIKAKPVPMECRKSYERFFAKNKIDIRIVFGYKDARPARFVGDRYERIALIEALQKHCTAERFDCDFQRSKVDADLLEKKIVGPDLRPHEIELRIASSAAGPDDQENASDPYQAWKSIVAKRHFLEGIRDADAIFYNGHSRGGGGPDFSPPRLDKFGHVDYRWYKIQRPGLREMWKQFRMANTMPKLVGLYSCVSTDLMPRNKGTLRTGWITFSHLLYFADALQSIKDSLSALVGATCPREFERVLKAKEPSSRLTGFF